MDPWGYSKSAGIARQLGIFKQVLSNLGAGQAQNLVIPMGLERCVPVVYADTQGMDRGDWKGKGRQGAGCLLGSTGVRSQ